MLRHLHKKINNAFRAEQVDRVEEICIDYLVPIIADGEAGFGGTLNVFELTKKFIEAGAAGVHFEDQLAAEKNADTWRQSISSTSQHIRTLTSARLASDTMGVPTVIIARTDALAANLITSDIDEVDSDFVLGERTSEGFFKVKMAQNLQLVEAFHMPHMQILYGVKLENQILDLQKNLRMQFMKSS